MCAGYDLKSELDRIEQQAAEAKKKAVDEVCAFVCARISACLSIVSGNKTVVDQAGGRLINGIKKIVYGSRLLQLD